MSNLYRQNAFNRSIGWSTWHLEGCTKYRYKVFRNLKYKNLCIILLYESAKRHKFTILDCEVDVDHVHVIASLPLGMTPLQAVHKMKGYTSKCLFLLRPSLRKDYKKKHLWSPGKFVGSVGHITLEKAKRYLSAHHAKPQESLLRNEVEESSRARAFKPGGMSNFSGTGAHAEMLNFPPFFKTLYTSEKYLRLSSTKGITNMEHAPSKVPSAKSSF
jgi:putative transposase